MNVLVVIDMQNDFITGSLGNEECVASVGEVAKEIDNPKYDAIVFTQDTHQENYMDTQEGKKLPVKHCIEGSEGWKVLDELTSAAEKVCKDGRQVVFLSKPSFGSLQLPKILKDIKGADFDNNDEITFVGVCTGICVLSNATIIKAAFPETPINVIEKACACVTKESHKTAIEAMKLIQINVEE